MDQSKLGPEDVAELVGELLRQLRSPIEPEHLSPEALAERRARDEIELAKRVSDSERERVMASIERAVPPGVYRIVVRGAEKTHAVEAALAWLDAGKHRALLLRGGVGVGKTVAAGAVVNALVERGQCSISWHRPNDFVSAVLHRYDEGAPKLGKDLVVIDDVGRETKPDFCEALCTFIDDFSARILLSTNDTKERFRSRYDLRLIDRLNEVGTSISIKGESLRGKDGGF
jgi:DNA replication protein DnaC